MSNDHYVAQTYLKHFGDPAEDGRLHAYRKTDNKRFPAWPRDVCHEWNGDDNVLLNDQGLLGSFREIFEPYWNPSVKAAVQGQMGYHDKYVIAGLMANLMVCTPAWRRVGISLVKQSTQSQLSFAKRMKLKHGGQPDLPVEAIEALERGEIVMDTDPNYVKGLATRQLMQYTWVIYNLDWTLITNDTGSPFVTSDNPVALSYSGAPNEPVVRFLPITPRLMLAVRFDPQAAPAATRISPQDLEIGLQRPPAGGVTFRECDRRHALALNAIQIRSAERLVFSSTESDETQRLVRRFAKCRMDVDVVEYPDPAGDPDAMVTGTILRVREH
jgi:hypothetical protein